MKLMINRYLLLLLILLTGFTSNDIRKEIIIIDWYPSTEHSNKLGRTFINAGYTWEDKHLIPVFVRDYMPDFKGQDFQFSLENPVFEEIDIDKDVLAILDLPSEPFISKTRIISGETHKTEIRIPVVYRQNEKVFILKKFDIKQFPIRMKSALTSTHTWKQESVLNNGRWVKISTTDKGIYKIPYSKLTSWGFSNPSQVRIFGAGGMILPEDPGNMLYDDLPQLQVWQGTSNGVECLFFYAPGNIEWGLNQSKDFLEHSVNPYAVKGHFFLTEQAGSERKVEVLSEMAEQPTHIIESFDAYALYEIDQFNHLQSGREWYGDRYTNGMVRNYSFPLTNAVQNTTASMRIKAAARSSFASQMQVSTESAHVGSLLFTRVNTSDKNALFAAERIETYTSMVSDGNLNVGLSYTGGGSSAEAWLDFIEINYRKVLIAGNEPLFFRDIETARPGNILEFRIESNVSNLKVWDITNPFDIKEIPLNYSGNKAIGKQQVSELREFAAFNPNGNFPEPEITGEIQNQNLHGLSTPDFLIITHPDFINQANELADFHRAIDGYNVEVVGTDKVYNEFSSGNQDATGIRNFIKMFYDRKEGLKYVLLFGDGSYDNKGIKGTQNNRIPTYQSVVSLDPVRSFVTDDYFVLLDSKESVFVGAIDLGIGRIPASTGYEADLAVRKIKNYHSEQALGKWRNVLCFIGDDGDNNRHMFDSEQLTNQINNAHPEFITDKIYFDAYQQITGPGGESYPDVTQAINDRVKEGVLILNYVGHANDRFMADEKVLDISHINSWSNTNNMPIFVTATCEFSRFDSDTPSAGEYIFFNPNGGGIGLFTTTRVVYSNSNFILSRSFYNFALSRDDDGNPYRMGDIMRLAKINTSNANVINKRNFSLLANPALKLSYPQHKVITTTINEEEPGSIPDTIGALQRITVRGYVADEFNNKLTNFSGDVIPVVYDKAVMKRTRGNAGANPLEFKVQENIIFQGLAEAVNGEFEFSFVVPKDISYNPGNGKIVYYAHNSETDAHGVFENFIISGSGSDIVDHHGPEIELYLDSPDFVSGDKVSMNPVLYAHISDENGINRVGSGIGHDITAVINDDYSKPVILNNFYQANAGDYSSGTIRYPLRNLPAGVHKLSLKVWDVANNSSEAEIEFEITSEFKIERVFNAPNPMSGYTFLSFEHNQSDATFDVVYEIFDMTGRRIDMLREQVGSNGRISNPVRWDLNESDILIRSGVYPYRVTVQNENGTIVSATGKMVVSR